MSVRTSCPSTDNKYYIKTTQGGYNKAILGNSANKYNPRPTKGSCLPNCVGYCFGRGNEISESKGSINYPTCNAKDWFAEAKKRGFKCDTTPAVGCVAVFKGTTYGHVAFVERIESNGDLFLSESNWGHQIFRNVTVSKKSGYNYSSSLKLVGFVHHPKEKELNKPKATKYKVNTAVLNIRTEPSTSKGKTTICGTYKSGTIVTVTETKGDWGKTDKGWISLAYCKKV